MRRHAPVPPSGAATPPSPPPPHHHGTHHRLKRLQKRLLGFVRKGAYDNDDDLEARSIPLQRFDRPLPHASTSSSTHQGSGTPRTASRLKQIGNMKFSHSLLFSTVPEWQSHYIAYENLKSAIYRFERENLRGRDGGDLESSALLDHDGNGHGDGDGGSGEGDEQTALFRRLLDKELDKIVEFYLAKERELLGDVEVLKRDIERIEHDDAFVSEGPGDEDEDEDSDDEDYEGAGKPTSTLMKIANRFGVVRIGHGPKKRRPMRRRALSVLSGVSVLSGASEEPSEDMDTVVDNSELAAPSESASLLKLLPPPGLHAPNNHALLDSTADAYVEADGEAAARLARGEGKSTAAGRSNSRRRPVSLSRPATGRRARALSSTTSDDLDALRRLSLPAVWTSRTDFAIDTRIMVKRRITELFTNLSELKSYADLNRTGFRKIVKKFDKITGSSLKDPYMKGAVAQAYPFTEAADGRLVEAIQELVPIYANIVTRGNEEMAKKQLKTHLREHVVWERNTVWREMIGLERRGWGTAGTDGGGGSRPMVAEGDQAKGVEVPVPAVGRVFVPWWINRRSMCGVVAVSLLIGLMRVERFERAEERNCLALLAFVTVMWAAEVVPLFVTSMLVPFLVVVLRVIRSEDGKDRRLSAPEATKYIFQQMLSPTIMLLIGGFTLAAALSKHNIDKVLASKVLGLAGTRPSTVLLAYMGVACFASMWISNVAAPVLCYSLIQPILRTLPPRSTFSKSLILGIALAANIGGQSSPISSPQNLIALQYMDPPVSWPSWFAVAIPVSAASVVMIWVLLLWSYGSGRGTAINPVRQTKDPFSPTQTFVLAVTGVTIVLWCVEHQLEDYVGDMAIIALIPLIVFFGTGVLRKSDFDNFPWSIVFLAMGGIALGKAVLSSGLLADADTSLARAVRGLDLWPILAVFSLSGLVVATFVSHTVAAVLLVPIAAQIGDALEAPHPRLLIMATALICSCGAGLPVSGFPNQTAINLEDDMGQRYLDVDDFLKNGIPASVLGTAVVITVGYLLMLAVGL